MREICFTGLRESEQLVNKGVHAHSDRLRQKQFIFNKLLLLKIPILLSQL